MNKNLLDLAQRIINVDFYGARDAGETVETVAAMIEEKPADVIGFLLDVIEEYQEGSAKE